MWGIEMAAVFNCRLVTGEHKNKKPVQTQFWTGFKALEYLSFSADPKYAFQAFRAGDYNMATQLFEEVQSIQDIRDYPKWKQFLKVKDWLENRFFTKA